MENNAQQSPIPPSIGTRLLFLIGAFVILFGSPLGLYYFWDDEDESSPKATMTDIPDVFFLGPADSSPVNLFRLDPQKGDIEQLSTRDEGLIEYAISPNGQWVAYTVRLSALVHDIWALNLQTGQEIQISNCNEAGASCNTPSWHRNSQQLAYTRLELDQDSGWANTDRVWIVDLVSRESQPLFDDLRVSTRFPVWSPVDDLIAVSLHDPAGVLLYDFATTQTLFMASGERLTGAFSPDGQILVYPALRFGEATQNYYTHLELVHIPDFAEELATESPGIQRLSGETSTAVEDGQAAIHPDGEQAAITRRYLDERYSQGYQIFLVDIDTGSGRELVFEPDYTHAALGWSADGRYLLYQRADPTGRNREIEIWLYDIETDNTRLLYANGYMPRFLNARRTSN